MRFQYSIRSLLLAIGWLSIGLGAFSTLSHVRLSDIGEWNERVESIVVFSLMMLSLVMPMIAVRQLIGWQREGGSAFWAIAGAWCIVWVCITLYVMH
jgi:hypothetical protein